MGNIRRCATAGALALATAAAAAPPMYVATLIPPVLGGHYNDATAINAAGQVAGTSNTLPGNWPHAFLFSGGFVYALGTPNGMFGSSAAAVNRHGQVAGSGYDYPYPQNTQAFVFSGGALKPLALAGYTTAAAINDRGQVAGLYEPVANALQAGYLLSGGTLTTIGGVIPATLAWPAAINAKGTIAGIAGPNHVFLYSNGTMTDIGPPGGNPAHSVAINDADQAVASTQTPPTYAWRAYRFSSGGWVPLDGLTPQAQSGASGINDAGQIVGWSSVPGPMIDHGFLYEAGVMYDLNSLLLTDLQGREIVNAIAINDSGQIAANACNINHTNCVAVRLDPFLPGVATVGGNPYGAITVTGGTYANGTLTVTQGTSEIQLGATPGAPGSQVVVDFNGLNFAPGTKLTVRAGAAGQTVVLNNVNPNATTVAGMIVAAGNNAGAPPPMLVLRNAKGIAIGAEGAITSPSGLTLDALTGAWTTGAGIVNQGTVDGGSSLVLQGSMINGSGAYNGNAVRISTFGNVNNPVHGPHFLANGLRLLPSSGGTVALTLNGYGASPQVFNVRVEGNAMVSMPSAWPSGTTYPVNNAPVLPGQFRPAGVPDPAYGGGSMIVQATGGLMLDGGVSHDFVFPGGLALVAAGSLDFNGVTVDNGWTTGGQPWQGLFFEAPVITSSAGLIDVRASDNNWINFNVKPNVGVRAWQLRRVVGGAAQFETADSVAPHLNTYSTQVEVAASGGCWTCTVNPDPVDMY